MGGGGGGEVTRVSGADGAEDMGLGSKVVGDGDNAVSNGLAGGRRGAEDAAPANTPARGSKAVARA